MATLTAHEAARVLGISYVALTKRLERGQFPEPDVPAVNKGGRNRWSEETIALYRERGMSYVFARTREGD